MSQFPKTWSNLVSSHIYWNGLNFEETPGENYSLRPHAASFQHCSQLSFLQFVPPFSCVIGSLINSKPCELKADKGIIRRGEFKFVKLTPCWFFVQVSSF